MRRHERGNFAAAEVSIHVLLLQLRETNARRARRSLSTRQRRRRPGVDQAGAARQSPLVAAAVIALAAVIGWHLRDDSASPSSSRTPADLGDARSLAARGATLDDNRYVTVSGQAERRYALYLEPKGVRARSTVFRVLGAPHGLFVGADDGADNVNPTERWTGRLRRFDAMPYAPSLRHYYATETEVTRYLALDALKARSRAAAASCAIAWASRSRSAPDAEARRRRRLSRASSRSTSSKDKYPLAGRRAPRARAHGAGARRPASRPRTSSRSSCRCPRRARTRSSASSPISRSPSSRDRSATPSAQPTGLEPQPGSASGGDTLVIGTQAPGAVGQRDRHRRARARRDRPRRLRARRG